MHSYMAISRRQFTWLNLQVSLIPPCLTMVALTIDNPLPVTVSSSTPTWSLGHPASNIQCQDWAQRLNIVPLPTLLLSLFGFNHFFANLAFNSPCSYPPLWQYRSHLPHLKPCISCMYQTYRDILPLCAWQSCIKTIPGEISFERGSTGECSHQTTAFISFLYHGIQSQHAPLTVEIEGAYKNTIRNGRSLKLKCNPIQCDEDEHQRNKGQSWKQSPSAKESDKDKG